MSSEDTIRTDIDAKRNFYETLYENTKKSRQQIQHLLAYFNKYKDRDQTNKRMIESLENLQD